VKKFVFIVWLLLILGLALGALAGLAGAAAAGLFMWLAVETQRRRRFSFLAQHRSLETDITVSEALHLGLASQLSSHALLVEHGPKLSLATFGSQRLGWHREFSTPPQAVLSGPEGMLYYATDDALVLCDKQGRDAARLSFEPPLFRQSYALHLSADGSVLALQTPWFIQFASPDLSRLGQRIRYEEAGHYLKYAALSADGKGLLLAGALLLDGPEDEAEGETKSGIEARWDYWTCDEKGHWSQAWAKAYESYNNSHLRGVAIQGSVLLAELYQEGYEFRLFNPAGEALWERPGGERALLSPSGAYLLWQNHFDGLVLSQVEGKQKLWARKGDQSIRLRAVDDQGRVLLLEGRQLSVLDRQAKLLWQDWFRVDPEQLSLGRGGRLCVVSGDRAGLIQVPFDC
jgi:hypothetical protein